jgi:DNA-binding NtrC family response regulator
MSIPIDIYEKILIMSKEEQKAIKSTVLFVDDDTIILQSLERSLLDEAYNKFFTNNCKEAMEIIRREKVHVIVTDMNMPEMTGLELLRTARHMQPDVIGVVLTECDDIELKTAVEQGEIFKFFPKPWKFGVTDFESLIRQAVDHYNLHGKHNTVKQ